MKNTRRSSAEISDSDAKSQDEGLVVLGANGSSARRASSLRYVECAQIVRLLRFYFMPFDPRYRLFGLVEMVTIFC